MSRQMALRWGRLGLVAAAAISGSILRADSPAPAPFPVWLAPPDAAKRTNSVPADTVSIAAGKELFEAACMPCHGSTGRGDGVAAPSLERAGKPIRPGNLTNPKLKEQADGALFWKVSNGNDPMPAFQDTYNDTQRWQIVNYIRTLAAPAPASAASVAAPPAAPKPGLSGAEAYAMHCARCHPERYPAERSAAQWKTIGLHMRIRANLPAAQVKPLIEYLQANSGN